VAGLCIALVVWETLVYREWRERVRRQRELGER
jgi:hypothetical protein